MSGLYVSVSEWVGESVGVGVCERRRIAVLWRVFPTHFISMCC